MSEQYSIYLQRRKLELVGTLWLNNTRGHISSAFTYAPHWLKAPGAFALSPTFPSTNIPRRAMNSSSVFRIVHPIAGAEYCSSVRKDCMHAGKLANHTLCLYQIICCAFRTVHGRAPYVFLQMEERVFWRNPARNQSLPLYLCQNFFVPRNM